MQHFGIGYRHMLEDARSALTGKPQEPGRRDLVLASLASEMGRVAVGLRGAMTRDVLVRPGDAGGFRRASDLRRRLPGMTVDEVADAAAGLARDASDALVAPNAPAPAVRGSLAFLDTLLDMVRTDGLYATQTTSA